MLFCHSTSDRGMTLLELVVTTAIILTVSVMTISFLTFTSRAARTSGARNLLSLSARGPVEELKNTIRMGKTVFVSTDGKTLTINNADGSVTTVRYVDTDATARTFTDNKLLLKVGTGAERVLLRNIDLTAGNPVFQLSPTNDAVTVRLRLSRDITAGAKKLESMEVITTAGVRNK